MYMFLKKAAATVAAATVAAIPDDVAFICFGIAEKARGIKKWWAEVAKEMAEVSKEVGASTAQWAEAIAAWDAATEGVEKALEILIDGGFIRRGGITAEGMLRFKSRAEAEDYLFEALTKEEKRIMRDFEAEVSNAFEIALEAKDAYEGSSQARIRLRYGERTYKFVALSQDGHELGFGYEEARARFKEELLSREG